jgi:hypothetical protein
VLLKVTPESVAAMKRLVDVLDAVEAGSLVEINRQDSRVVLMTIVDSTGKVPACMDEIFAYAAELD